MHSEPQQLMDVNGQLHSLPAFTVREEHRLCLFQNMVPGGIYASKRGEVTGKGEDCTMRRFTICSLHGSIGACMGYKKRVCRALAGKCEG
jgi:hypothetical protein